MFDFSKVKEKVVPLTPDTILSRITPTEIYSRYLGYTPKTNFNYKSPFRPDDNIPSFGLYYGSKTGDLMFKDLGGNNYTGNCFIFVQKLFNESFFQALARINHDFHLGLGKETKVVVPTEPIYTPEDHKEDSVETIISFNQRSFTQDDIAYWNIYGITLAILKEFNVYSCSEVFINNNLKFKNVPGQPIYAYCFEGGYTKIYRPFSVSKKDKWRSNCNREVIQGAEQLPQEGEMLVITKSLKDVMVFSIFGIPAIAPQSESPFLPDSLVNNIEERFTNIIVNFDNDDTGMKNGNILANNNGWDTFFIPKVYQVKDISDFYEKYGHTNTIRLIENLLL